MPRDYMIAHRESLRIPIEKMASKLKISPWLLNMLEQDESCVTHPEIAKRIAKAYKLTKEQKTMMLPENYRPGPNYDPDKYRILCDTREGLRNYKLGERSRSK